MYRNASQHYVQLLWSGQEKELSSTAKTPFPEPSLALAFLQPPSRLREGFGFLTRIKVTRLALTPSELQQIRVSGIISFDVLVALVAIP